MNNEETVAASSTADDVFGGQQPTLEEYNSYRNGELPERFKPAEQAEVAPADSPEETVEPEEPESEPESEPEEAQEKKGSGAEKRIKQLLAEKKELQRKLEAAAKPETKPDTPPPTRSKPTIDDKKDDGTQRFSTYEEFIEELTEWKAKELLESAKRESQQQESLKALQTKLESARSRYDDADEVIFPTGKAIHDAQIPPAVKAVFEDSDVFLDLCYVVGSDPDELKKFIALARTSPRAAIGMVFEYERGIKAELATPVKAPEVKKTAAPKPPSPVGGPSSRGFDVSDESLSPDEWMRKRTQDIQKKRG